jgi:hypothetical protein
MAAALELAGDVFRDVLGPTLRGMDGNNPDHPLEGPYSFCSRALALCPHIRTELSRRLQIQSGIQEE